MSTIGNTTCVFNNTFVAVVSLRDAFQSHCSAVTRQRFCMTSTSLIFQSMAWVCLMNFTTQRLSGHFISSLLSLMVWDQLCLDSASKSSNLLPLFHLLTVSLLSSSSPSSVASVLDSASLPRRLSPSGSWPGFFACFLPYDWVSSLALSPPPSQHNNFPQCTAALQ